MNVAVVLNTAAAPNRKAWSKDEIANIDGILRSGLGIDADRGDQLRVSVLPFAAKMPEQAWWQERDNVVDAVSWLSYLGAATCGAQVLLDQGEPDFPRRIVGRCQESPREHVFSFDRATRTGYRLR